MMAIKLVSLIWNKTLLISFVADESSSIFKRRFNFQIKAPLTTAMTIAGMMYNTADIINRVSNFIMCWIFDSVAIVIMKIMTVQNGTFSVSLEKGKLLSLVRMAKSNCCMYSRVPFYYYCGIKLL